MNVYIRRDWRDVELIPGIKLGDTVVSASFPDLARKIIPTERQAENAYLLAKLFFRPVFKRFGQGRITSWIRDFDLNRAVGGVGDSGHLYGTAADFECPASIGEMSAVFLWCRDVMDWPGELFHYRKRGHCHADLPRSCVEIADRRELE